MWLLSNQAEGDYRAILINIETGMELRLKQHATTGASSIILLSANSNRGVGSGGEQTVSRYTDFATAATIFSKIARKLGALDAQSIKLDHVEG